MRLTAGTPLFAYTTLFRSTGTTGAIAVGGTATGNIETVNDTDWFRTTLTAGRTYQFGLEGSATGQGALAGTRLNASDATGASALAGRDKDGTGFDSRFTYP